MDTNREYKKLRKQAIKNGWKTPVLDFPDKASWIDYWQKCALYADGLSEGRPIAPHKSGGQSV